MRIGNFAGGSAFIENAGACASVGQDHSERAVQFAGAMPQFSSVNSSPASAPSVRISSRLTSLMIHLRRLDLMMG